MLNVKIATAALAMIVGASSFAFAANTPKVHSERAVSQSATQSSVYEGRSAYDSQQPMVNSQTGLNGADNLPAR